MLTRLPLRLRILLIFAGLAGAVMLIFAFALWVEARRLAETGVTLDEALSPMVLAGFIAGLGATLAIAAVWLLFDRHVARPIEALAGGLRTGQPPDPGDSRYLADLGPAALDAAEARARSAEALAEALDAHAAEQAREKATLESILADFGAAAVMTDARQRVVFFNPAAARMMPGLALDRRLQRHLRPGALDEAYRRLEAGRVRATDLSVLTLEGTRLAGRLRQIEDGTLLILRDRPPERPESRAAIEELRRHAATLVPMLEAMDGPIPPALAQAIRSEGQGLAAATRALSNQREQAMIEGTALLSELATGLETAEAELPHLAVKAEAGPMNALLLLLYRRMTEAGQRPVFNVAADQPDEISLMLEWDGPLQPMDELEGWLAEPLDPAQPDLTGEDLLARHGSGIWADRDANGGRARLILPLPRAAGHEAGDGDALTYDFSLAARGAASTLLTDLTCVVFDTETTGLDPATDCIVQIAGLRMAAGRPTGERFDTLVNPGRPIPPGSTTIHGITDAMVANAPDMTTALAAFHHFAEDSVLVAHNAPFDMGFLRRAAPETGVQFDNRIMDTVLLSAMVWGQSAEHSLDALCERLQISIPPELRHTAMGDTEATAEAFLRLVPALAAKGIKRFEDVQEQARKHKRLIVDANFSDKTGD